MTVKELIEKLQEAPQDAEVLFFQADYRENLYSTADSACMRKVTAYDEEDDDFIEEREYFVISSEDE